MGCTASIYAVGRRKRPSIPEVVVYVPSMRIPAQSDIQRTLKGLIPRDLVDRLACLRNQIVLVAEDTGLVSQSKHIFYVLFRFLSKCTNAEKKQKYALFVF